MDQKQNVSAFFQAIFLLLPLELRCTPLLPARSGLRRLLWAFLLALAIHPVQVIAQKEPGHKKIGLVLSGGGAKGFAHIGVLKVIDSLGIKIDYIGGTSMGAVIGGLYASGYTAKQIDSIFKSTDFDALLRDYIPRSSKNFFEKRNDEIYALSLPFNKFKVGIPTALSKGTYNYNLLAKLTDKVRHVRDFNKLPIPFLCIATDVETGEALQLRSGYLAQAMQASSAFPSLFSPVEIDGRLLVDGGVTNNYPIDEVRKMGADIIIGVDVQDGLKNRTALRDATRILVQISNMEMIEKMKKKQAETDVYIKPDMSDFSVISFADGASIIRNGSTAALSVVEELKKYATTPGNPQRKAQIVNDSLTIKRINTTTLDNYTRAYIIGKLRFKPDSKISYEDLKNGVDNLNASQNFSSISYALEANENGDDLAMNLKENPVRTYLKFGLHYDGLYKSSLLVNLTYKNAIIKNDVASIDVILGDNFRYNLEYYIDNGFYLSFGFRSRLNGFNRNVRADFSGDDNPIVDSYNIDFTDWTNEAYLQTIFVQKYLIGAGLEHKYLRIKSETLPDSSPFFENSSYLSAFGYFKFDSLDNKYFPKKGIQFCGDFHSYLYSTDYTGTFEPFSVAKGNLSVARTLFKRATFRFDSEAGFAIGARTVEVFNFILGGYGFQEINNIKPFYGYDFLSLNADSYIKSTFTLDYEFIRKNHVNLSANFAQLGDRLFTDTDWISKPSYTGYAVGYGLETILGPAEVKYTWSPELNKGFTWFSVGFWF